MEQPTLSELDDQPNGLKRRVAGAQRPDVPAAGTRLALLDDEDTAATGDAGDPIDDGTEPIGVEAQTRSYSFLSNFQSGVARGRADSNVDEQTRRDDDERGSPQLQLAAQRLRREDGRRHRRGGGVVRRAADGDVEQPRPRRAEQLAAIISGLVSLGNGASTCFGFDGLEQVIVTMRRGFLFVSSISDGSCLGVVATKRAATSASSATRRRCSSSGPAACSRPTLVAELKQEMLVS